MFISILLFVLGTIFISYDVILICSCPGTFLDNVISFTHIWSALGLYCIFCGIWRIKKGSAFVKAWSKKVRIAVFSLVGAAAIISVVNLCFIMNPVLASEDDEVDYVILLGGGISKDGKLPKSVVARGEKAAEYLNQHRNAVCVVTGGTLHFLPVAEAPELKRLLVQNGVEADKILVEDQALDTIQNFQYSCKMLADFEGVSQQQILDSRIAVVTSYFHLRRAERLAKRMGFTCIKGVGSKTPPLNVVHTYVREICAYIKLNLRIMLTGQPKKIN